MSPSSKPSGVQMPTQRGLFYGGAWHAAKSGRQLETINPANQESLGLYADADAADVDAAVQAAHRAFRSFRATRPAERASMLREAARILRLHADELAMIDSVNGGNPYREMRNDAGAAAAQLEYFAGLVQEVKGQTIPVNAPGLNFTVREPYGVVGRIYPFNHPFMFGAGKIAAPIAAGNTVVIKPPEQAPLSTLRLVELLQNVFPPGVLNCVTGGKDTGAALSAHPLVAKVALIGSPGAGQAVVRSSADSLKRVLLELGGKNALIVYPDADLAKAAQGAVRGMNFLWCGQSCGSTSRLFLHESIHDQVLDAVVQGIRAAHTPGVPTDEATTMGCLVSQAQYDKTMHYIELGKSEGARLVTGGKRPDDPRLAKGFFVEPTVFADVKPTMRIAREEIFGPVLSVIRWKDEEEMFEAVNGTPFGLTCSIWTNDVTTAVRASQRVEAGYVWVNHSSSHFLGAPFGGYKLSGIGREECLEELFEFTQVKNIHISLA